jgi:hypothetical protein
MDGATRLSADGNDTGATVLFGDENVKSQAIRRYLWLMLRVCF